MLRVQRDLVRAPETFNLVPVDLAGAGPALGGAQHDHRPLGQVLRTPGARLVLDGSDLVHHRVQGRGKQLVDRLRIVAFDEIRLVAIATHELFELRVTNACQQRRVGDLVAVQVQDGQHRAVARRVEELDAVPGRGERPGLRFAVADHAGDDQIRVVEGHAEGVRQAVAQFSAFVQRARCFRRAVAADAARERELREKAPEAVFALTLVRIDLAVSAFEPGLREHRGRAMAGTRDKDDVEIPALDQAVEVGPDQRLAGVGAPVAEQAFL